LLKLYIYHLEDVEDDNFDNVRAIDVIEGADNAACEAKFNNRYCSNDYGCTYSELPLTHGGYRPGAGRKPTGRSKRQYYLSDPEDAHVKQLIDQIRNPS
jgi:hypothetical protein